MRFLQLPGSSIDEKCKSGASNDYQEGLVRVVAKDVGFHGPCPKHLLRRIALEPR